MTYEKLLAEINDHYEFARLNGATSETFPALLAVLNLHKPIDDNSCHHCATWYPCRTFQAIEKELM